MAGSSLQPQFPQNPSFNEQQAWDDIQTKLATTTLTDERRLRELRETLYRTFLKTTFDQQLAQSDTGDKAMALQHILKTSPVIREQAGRDKVFRDDLIHEVEKRTDRVVEDPFDKAEEKLAGLSTIYEAAKAVDAQSGGVTQSWAVRRLREKEREYALSLIQNYPDKVAAWSQKDTRFAKRLRAILEEQEKKKTMIDEKSISSDPVLQDISNQVEKQIEEQAAPASEAPETTLPQTPTIEETSATGRGEDEVEKARVRDGAEDKVRGFATKIIDTNRIDIMIRGEREKIEASKKLEEPIAEAVPTSTEPAPEIQHVEQGIPSAPDITPSVVTQPEVAQAPVPPTPESAASSRTEVTPQPQSQPATSEMPVGTVIPAPSASDMLSGSGETKQEPSSAFTPSTPVPAPEMPQPHPDQSLPQTPSPASESEQPIEEKPKRGLFSRLFGK